MQATTVAENVNFQPSSHDLSPAARHLITISPEQLAGELWVYKGSQELRILKDARDYLAGSSAPDDICRHRLIVEQIMQIEGGEA